MWRKHTGDVYLHASRMDRSNIFSISPSGPEPLHEEGYKDGDVVSVEVDFSNQRVSFYTNGRLSRRVNGMRTDVPVVPLVTIGASDVTATLVG
eukprot:CAMPEP_0169456036 /NCGR_PEP_ID=MMETSP1042-20121227/16137_1 /TAXON_ID=464988 /ORGANISM="Hemiselmis andersenii, Strain CCMP1180" /LENGTH=92 /DNA_ID=CAMNT_0009568229 /DNA_START=392 /DNA_END=667 /DNA_ORIENTATION=+